jgi:CRISPR system Cascade subunit CasB
MSNFIEWLEGLNKKDTKVRAVLRRSLAFDPVFYLVAGLWAAHLKEERSGPPIPIGKACASFQRQSGAASTERRFINLLDADASQLPHRLRQILALLKDHPIDFDGLLKGLLYWNDDQKRTQNAWARDFYRYMNHEIETERTQPEVSQ